MIKNPAITEDWANAYFWLNEVTPESQKLFAVLAHGLEYAPPSWEMIRMETAAGILDHAILGPFPAEESLIGPHGVANCSGGAIWFEASALIDKVWPVLVAINGSSLPCRFECEPPRPVEGDDFSELLRYSQAMADADRAKRPHKIQWKSLDLYAPASVVADRIFQIELWRGEIGWKRHSSFNNRVTLSCRMIRGRTWRKNQALAKRRGKIHFRRHSEYLDDIPF